MPIGYACDAQTGGCGITRGKRWYGPCPGCHGLYHCKQAILDRDDNGEPGEVFHRGGVRELGRVEAVTLERIPTGFDGVDQILGTDNTTGISGIAATAGHAIQLYGAPGSAKSTLLLQACQSITRDSYRVLYVAGEEGVEQVKARADRIGKFNSRMLITEEVDLDRLFCTIQDLEPDLCVVDSLQKIRVGDYALGSQQAAVIAASDLCKLAGKRGMGLLLINQMNKAGDDFSGAKAVEHSVDTSLFLQLQRDRVTRVLRCDTKNRYGKTPARQSLTMTDAGLVELDENEEETKETEGQFIRRGNRLRERGLT